MLSIQYDSYKVYLYLPDTYEQQSYTFKKIETAGGILALPKQAIPGMAWQAYYKDTEGNIFGIHQPDVNAK